MKLIDQLNNRVVGLNPEDDDTFWEGMTPYSPVPEEGNKRQYDQVKAQQMIDQIPRYNAITGEEPEDSLWSNQMPYNPGQAQPMIDQTPRYNAITGEEPEDTFWEDSGMTPYYPVDTATTTTPPVATPEGTPVAAPKSIADKFGEMVKTRAEAEIKNGPPVAEKKWYDLLINAGKATGNALSLSFDAFQKLSPSTKVALIGAAGTAWAYSKGGDHRAAAGDIALGTANLYGDMYSKELARDTALGVASASAKAKAAEAKANAEAKVAEARAKEVKTDYTAADREQVNKQIADTLANDPKFKDDLFKWGEEEERASKVYELVDKYFQFLQGNRKSMTQYPVTKFIEDYRNTEEYQSR